MTKNLPILSQNGFGHKLFSNTHLEKHTIFTTYALKLFEQDLIGVTEVEVKRKRWEYAYWSSQLRYGSLIGEWATVTSVWHKDTWKKHWTQVISIQNVHCEGGGGGSPFI